jgi:glycosyltransferase involved in cell wall biosynthesis
VTRRQLRGAEVFAAQLSERLVRAGLEITIAGLYPPGDPPLAPEGCEPLDLSARTARGISPGLLGRLAGVLRAQRPDLIQANGSDTLKYSVLARRLASPGVPLVYRNISVSSHWLRTPFHWAFNRWLLHRVDHVVAVSQRSRDDLVATYGLSPEGITVLPRGVETDLAEPREDSRLALAEAVGCDPQRPILVHVGSFTEEKNHRGLLRVLSRVEREHPGSQLVFFGDGPLRDEIRTEASKLGLESRVFAPGTRPDAPALAAGADLLVLFSFVEGMPGVVLEAGARGMAVVASRVGGVAEAVADGESGLLVEPGDEEACAMAVSRLLADPALRRRLGEALNATVREHYALDALAVQYLELYRRLTASSSERVP